MSNKIENQDEVNSNLQMLEELVEQYGYNKTQADYYTKQAKKENEIIKRLLHEQNLTSFKSKTFEVKKTITEQKSMDEEALIPFITQHKEFEGVVKLKEYVDWDELEKKIYNNEIPTELVVKMHDFEQVKPIIKLNFNKIKKDD